MLSAVKMVAPCVIPNETTEVRAGFCRTAHLLFPVPRLAALARSR
jgi:hypothetical protein